MNNQKQFDDIYHKSEIQEDDLIAALQFLSENPLILSDMLSEYLKSTISLYACLQGEIESIDLLKSLASLLPSSFAKMTRRTLKELSDDQFADFPEGRKDAVEWFADNHPEIYQDFSAEEAETESNFMSPRAKAVREKCWEEILKKLKLTDEDEGGYSGHEGRNEPPGH